jgi:predicted ATPase/class 3 adenylate cyclase
MTTVCPDCGRKVRAHFAFCPACGAHLGERQSPGQGDERKVVSVLFCDLAGFTFASEQADPEDVRARLEPYHEQLRRVIEAHGGVVEKFIGDAVMAVFGAPRAHEDDAERAVRAGLRILEAVKALNDQNDQLRLQVRIGVHTGEVVVRVGAHPERGEAFVTGDVVNTASRLQTAAPVDSVVVSERTHAQTQRIFSFQELSPIRVKGKAEPLPIWQALTPRARPGSGPGGWVKTPLVGREPERSVLLAAFERTVQQRTCQLVTLVGEPGIGKTRLCAELLEHVEQRPELVRWRQGQCLPYGDGISFWALGEIVKAECGILESDSAETARAKLEEVLPDDAADRAWLRARLSPLLGAGGEPAGQEETFTAWRRFLTSWAASRPTVLLFEDLHWADPALLAFISHLADWVDDVPLLLVGTARPELFDKHPGWAGGLRNAQTLNLGRLSQSDTHVLLSLLLQQEMLDQAAEATLAERVGGNPLYAEEFVRLLVDRQLLHAPLAQIPVPDSLQAVIASRVDTLSAERKTLLQDAAVVGTVFWAGAVAQMGHRTRDEVERALHELSRKELVRPAQSTSMQGETEYSFWHAVVRDVCYAQIPRAGRVARHRAAAAWIEAATGERPQDLADLLAYHYQEALALARTVGPAADVPDLEEAARRFLGLAGERALSIDTARAETCFAQALAVTPAGHPRRAELLEGWALALKNQGRLHDAKSASEEALALCRSSGDTIACGRVLTSLAAVLGMLGEPGADQAVREAVAFLESEPPSPELMRAHAYLTVDKLRRGSAAEAVAAGNRAVELAEELQITPPPYVIGQWGIARAEHGEASGIEDVRRAISDAIRLGQAADAAALYNNLAIAVWEHQGPAAAQRVCEEGLAFVSDRGMSLWALVFRSGRLTFLAGAGHPEAVLAEAPAVEASGEVEGNYQRCEARAARLRILANRGDPHIAEIDELLLEAPRNLEMAWLMAGAAVDTYLAALQPEKARTFLLDLTKEASGPENAYYSAALPAVTRAATWLGAGELAAQLVAGVPSLLPLQRHALTACRGILAEARGEHASAALEYAQAAAGWRVFGDVPELAHALLGQGRCLDHLGSDDARTPVTDARELFASMGFQPKVEEADAIVVRLDAHSPAASAHE